MIETVDRILARRRDANSPHVSVWKSVNERTVNAGEPDEGKVTAVVHEKARRIFFERLTGLIADSARLCQKDTKVRVPNSEAGDVQNPPYGYLTYEGVMPDETPVTIEGYGHVSYNGSDVVGFTNYEVMIPGKDFSYVIGINRMYMKNNNLENFEAEQKSFGKKDIADCNVLLLSVQSPELCLPAPTLYKE